ncbi:Ptm1p KNAG_0A07120 [Huiozyma naganishii CBS 8797]|uniref:Membrane protein PTM1 n=1 Tax=Huiozyma naganishii (strain ATCC MYA-139 / BCRC 22969 / CBS 8797 / KCTC 17520 / NBRC 10181 / NCYC 3082 / Yp74L-3) TaxID=1071383 RepID=J7R0M6_HUIN7|nr:hypothetical protein KNAG_0A07120 [Kazachstania naganishii CBS 8797]CCK68365.1 hypothetical protein KNAG_0A07120 [Kazachstania naganishii CBS 8797]
MKWSLYRCVVLLLWQVIGFAAANKEKLNKKNYEVCSGMYSKNDWHGKVDPFISFNLKKLKSEYGEESSVSVAIYDFQDYLHLGVQRPDGTPQYICDDYAIGAGLCEDADRGTFIVEKTSYDPFDKENKTLVNPIMTFSQDSVGLHDTKYPISKTGFYCVTVFTSSEDVDFNAVVNFRNSYGHLSGAEINKLPLYGLLAVGYVVAMCLFLFAFWKHKHELLPLQKYVLAFYVFLTAETIFVWAYFDLKNEKGDVAGTKVYMVFLSLMTGGKIVFSFFLLLIVALGYGIVYPKLNKTLMRRCQFYSAFSYVACCAFLIHSYLSDPEAPSPLIFISFAPFVVTMAGFYIMILRSMTKTVGYLKEQRQVVKLGMYKKLLMILYGAMVVLMIGLVITSIIFTSMNSIKMVEKNWRSRFFFTDFWPSLVYFCVFVVISFIWRPTDTSYMLAVSQQLPTDPENVADFDLSDLQSLGEPLDDTELGNDDNLSIVTNDDNFQGSPQQAAADLDNEPDFNFDDTEEGPDSTKNK